MHAWFHPTTKLLAQSTKDTKASSCALRSGSFGAKWQGKVLKYVAFVTFFPIDKKSYLIERPIGWKLRPGFGRHTEFLNTPSRWTSVTKKLSFEVGSAMPFHVTLLLNEDHNQKHDDMAWQCVSMALCHDGRVSRMAVSDLGNLGFRRGWYVTLRAGCWWGTVTSQLMPGQRQWKNHEEIAFRPCINYWKLIHRQNAASFTGRQWRDKACCHV